jgi:eukaryotic-like serine/threonine-protein kinase
MKECPSCHRCFPDKLNHCPSDGDRLNFLIALDTVLDERYQLERKLGQGGMGMVFKARHVFIKTQHAIKIILPDLVGNDPSLVARFRQEAMASAAIRHPNTVSVTDYGILNNRVPYLVMEFVEGQSLHEILTREGRLTPSRAVEIMLAICAGVAAAHRIGIVHRDLKPLNILIKPELPPSDGLKVLDFGLAKIKSGELLGSLVAAQTQGMMGSPFYMAPEQWSDEDIDVRADIYSLGVMLYQMLAGDVPFKGKSIPSIMNLHLNAAPVALSERGIEVPEAVEQAVRRALEKDPARRPQTVDEFIAELRAAVPGLNGGGVEPGVGMATVQISPADLTGSHGDRGVQTGAHAATPDSFNTVASTPDALGARAREGEPTPVGRATVAGVPDARGTDSLADAAPPPHDTAPQRPAHTFDNLDADAARRTSVSVPTEPLTSFADTRREDAEAAEELRRQLAEEQERREAESRLRQEAEEQARREAEQNLRRGAEERRAEEERRRREDEERQRREAEERQRREAEERQRYEAEERQRREAEERAAAEERERAAALAAQGAAGPAAQRQAADAYAQSGPHVSQAAVAASAARPSPWPVWPIVLGGGAALLLLLALGGVGVYFIVRNNSANRNAGANTNARANVNANTNARTNTNASANANNTGANDNANQQGGTRPDLVSLPGGTFTVGRADVPPISGRYSQTYLTWVYSQWPAHAVQIKPFAIDRTEVTNAEYAEFVKATKHAPPPSVWDGDHPKQGEEQLPVSNVSLDDARAFAEWRSRRDGATYRLPTEDEWEYAARGGDPSRVFPWGGEWEPGRANLGTGAARPVGSFPQGNTAQGVADMIGNVWEWTGTEASLYKGNDKTRMLASDKGKFVVRGGSFNSVADGDEPVTATARRWMAHDFRDPVLGFRLVRAEP